MTNVGEMRYRVPIREKTAEVDSEGLVTSGYSDDPVAIVWASMTPVGGEIAQRKYGIVEDGIFIHTITRPNPNVKEQNVIDWRGKSYEIRLVKPFIDRYESLLKRVQA